jgi:hypothetical protein
LCEGEDLNLHGSYPASTSTQLKAPEGGSDAAKSAIVRRSEGSLAHWSAGERTQFGELPQSQAANAKLIRLEAIAILQAATRGEAVELERAIDFATSVIGSTVSGSLALEVLKGGPFTSSRLVALAAAILVSNGVDEVSATADHVKR